MKRTILAFSIACVFTTLFSFAQQAPILRPVPGASAGVGSVMTASAAVASAGVTAGSNGTVRVRHAPVVLPPEAFTVPKNYVLVVNHKGAVDDKWLEGECDLMRKQLRVAVRFEDADGMIGNDPRAFVKAIRAKHDDKAKIVLVISQEPGMTPILAAPYEYWAMMDASWVKAGGGDDATINLRMGKRLFQCLGHCIGAGYRQEREAVMRYTPTPTALDDCLSHGFHPLNSNIFFLVQNAIGLEGIRLRPRKELIAEGILKPRPPQEQIAPAAPVSPK